MTLTALIIAGVACIAAGGLLFYKLMPRADQPPSAWTSTDARGTVVAMTLLVLVVGGVGMLLKGLLS